MKIALATDHAGFELKQKVKNFLEKKGFDVVDFGAFSFDPNDDYPDFITPAAEVLSRGEVDFAILFGGSGQGEAICANRHKNVRTAVFYGNLENTQTDTNQNTLNIIKSARKHNNANALSIGARFTTEAEVMQAIETFLNTEFSFEEKHQRRIDKIESC